MNVGYIIMWDGRRMNVEWIWDECGMDMGRM